MELLTKKVDKNRVTWKVRRENIEIIVKADKHKHGKKGSKYTVDSISINQIVQSRSTGC